MCRTARFHSNRGGKPATQMCIIHVDDSEMYDTSFSQLTSLFDCSCLNIKPHELQIHNFYLRVCISESQQNQWAVSKTTGLYVNIINYQSWLCLMCCHRSHVKNYILMLCFMHQRFFLKVCQFTCGYHTYSTWMGKVQIPWKCLSWCLNGTWNNPWQEWCHKLCFFKETFTSR